MEVVVKGAQDVLLTGNPEKSPFRHLYKRSSPFALCDYKSYFIGGNLTLFKRGDLLSKCYLMLEDFTGRTVIPSSWSGLFDTVDLYIGGQLIDSQDYTYSSLLWPALESDNLSQSAVPGTFYPLRFFFCNSWSSALPIAGIKCHDVEFRITNPSPNYKFVLWQTFINLGDEERAMVPSEMVITQVQRVLTAGKTNYSELIGPVKYLASQTPYQKKWKFSFSLPPNNDGTYYFGWGVALSGDGSTAIVGDPSQSWVGIFTKSENSWSDVVALTDVPPGFTGGYVGISDDGSRAVVSCGFLQPITPAYRGAAGVYTKTNGSWSELPTLLPSPAPVSDYFKRPVSISGDGYTVIAGQYDTNWAGIYTKTGSSWSEAVPLAPESGAQQFGYSVSISRDGSTAIVGDPGNNWAGIYTKTGSSWSAAVPLAPENGAQNFGWAVALSGDASTAIVGDPDNNWAGIYTKTDGSWSAAVKLEPEIGAQQFGYSVSISSDGSTVIVGDGVLSAGVGANWAGIYTKTGSSWSEAVPLTPESGARWFGGAVALSGDGSTAIIGDPGNAVAWAGIYNFI
jgi:lipocalin